MSSRVDAACAAACVVCLLTACAGQIGGHPSTTTSGGWSTDPALPSGTSGTVGVSGGGVEDRCEETANPVLIDGDPAVVTGTSCDFSS